jgi:hypothetical protein
MEQPVSGRAVRVGMGNDRPVADGYAISKHPRLRMNVGQGRITTHRWVQLQGTSLHVHHVVRLLRDDLMDIESNELVGTRRVGDSRLLANSRILAMGGDGHSGQYDFETVREVDVRKAVMQTALELEVGPGGVRCACRTAPGEAQVRGVIYLKPKVGERKRVRRIAVDRATDHRRLRVVGSRIALRAVVGHIEVEAVLTQEVCGIVNPVDVGRIVERLKVPQKGSISIIAQGDKELRPVSATSRYNERRTPHRERL